MKYASFFIVKLSNCRIVKLISLIFLFPISITYGQDPQLSQYYNAPLYLNPALAGAGLDTRAGLNYRMQWPGFGDPYKTFSAWIDHDFYKIRSGVGFMINRDVQGLSKLRSTDINLLYSYQINVTDQWTLKPAIQLGLGIRDFDFSKSIFGDQLDNNGSSGGSTADPLATQNGYVYPDISAGIVGYNQNLWLGFSSHHLNRPNQSFTDYEPIPLPIKWSIIGGYKILMQERHIAWGAPVRETSFTPTFLYKTQGTSDQLDLGFYMIHNQLLAGFWYRGLPVKKYRVGISNNESVVLMVGVNHKGLSIGYSYDITVSQISRFSGGSHELSLIYQFQLDKGNRKGIKGGHRPMPCPNVDRQFKRNKF